jgi:uroporphyrinogen-III decarboxylase
MKEEYMTPKERVEAAIHFEQPDRVPIIPLATLPAAAGILDKNLGDLHRNPKKALDAVIELYDKYGGWDAANLIPNFKIFYNLGGFAVKVPGIDLPDTYQIQFDEQEYMKIEDYKTVADIGWRRFVKQDYLYRITDMEPKDLDAATRQFWKIAGRASYKWMKREVGLMLSVSYFHPFFTLSLNRSLIKFTEDLYYRPEMVEAAIDTMTDDIISAGISRVKKLGYKFIFMPEERAEGAIYPLKIFERFWWPYTKRIVEAWHAEGIRTWFHLDQCWDLNLPYFRELPKSSCIIDLDGLTDIFAAKDLLKNHLCIMSDVNASLFSLGTPKQVEDYCKKIIDKLGVDGGHILGSGCEVPPNCKPENFKAFIETGKTHQLSK